MQVSGLRNHLKLGTLTLSPRVVALYICGTHVACDIENDGIETNYHVWLWSRGKGFLSAFPLSEIEYVEYQ